MKAWLVTWEWGADAVAVADAVVAFYNPRWSSERVAPLVEQLYAERTSTLAERAAYAKRPSNNPYPARKDFNGHILCGAHPWLYARVVEALKIQTEAGTGVETATWVEPPIYKSGEYGPVQIRDRLRGRFERRVTGPVSHANVWDRDKGVWREGWEGFRGPTYEVIEREP